MSLPPFWKSHCLPIHPFHTRDPNKHSSAWPARWIKGLPPLLSSLLLSSSPFPVLIAPQESRRGLYVRFYLQRRTGGKLNEAWTWEHPHLSFSRGCSKHIKGNISNVQNKWRDVKTPKDLPPPATLSRCHKSRDPFAHGCTETEEAQRSLVSSAWLQCNCHKEAFHFHASLQMWAACFFAKGFFRLDSLNS